MLVFFKQKTAYEMRISDWSSYVCSSDLGVEEHLVGDEEQQWSVGRQKRRQIREEVLQHLLDVLEEVLQELGQLLDEVLPPRSEERRVGKECVRTSRSRWSQNH